jgi:hypothetical protein
MIVSAEVAIAGPPDDVFAYLADSSNWASIDETLMSIEPSGPLDPGSSGWSRSQRTGLKVRTEWEITAFEPARRFEVLITGPGYTMRETIVFDVISTGTRAGITDELHSTSLTGRLLVALAKRPIKTSLHARKLRLKELVEDAADR